jgi:hypothetical protein
VWLTVGNDAASPQAALQDTTHIAVEARNLSVSMAELVRADGVRGTAVAEVTGDAYGPQAPTVNPCRRLLRKLPSQPEASNGRIGRSRLEASGRRHWH